MCVRYFLRQCDFLQQHPLWCTCLTTTSFSAALSAAPFLVGLAPGVIMVLPLVMGSTPPLTAILGWNAKGFFSSVASIASARATS